MENEEEAVYTAERLLMEVSEIEGVMESLPESLRNDIVKWKSGLPKEIGIAKRHWQKCRMSDEAAAYLDKPVYELYSDVYDGAVRLANCLHNAGFKKVRDVVVKTELDMLRYRNFGRKTLKILKDSLERRGLKLGLKGDGTFLLSEAEKVNLAGAVMRHIMLDDYGSNFAVVLNGVTIFGYKHPCYDYEYVEKADEGLETEGDQ